MSAATAILYRPLTLFTFFPKIQSPNTIFFPEFRNSKKLGFSRRKSFSRKPFSWGKKIWRPNTTWVSMKSAAAFSGSTDDGVDRGFEQEVLVHGSSEFRPNNVPNGLESTLNNQSKWLVSALFGAVILWRHDAGALWAAMGSVLNAWLSTVLKKILNQERPVSTIKSDPGMPSSHAQSIFFSAMFAVLSMVEWLGLNTLSITFGGLVLAFGAYLSWLRVSLRFHTISQVVVGASLGSIFSVLWFWSWNAIVLKAFIDHLWVRAVIVLGATGFCVGFLVYVIRYWVMDEQQSL